MIETKQVSGRQAVSYRNYRRARDKALVRLSHLYPNLYQQLLEEQRRFDEKEGKHWSISSDSRLTIHTRTRSNAVPAPRKSSSNARKNKGNNGGKA
jgi:hypothetical protein